MSQQLFDLLNLYYNVTWMLIILSEMNEVNDFVYKSVNKDNRIV